MAKTKKSPRANNWKERVIQTIEKVSGNMVARKLKNKSLDEKAAALIRILDVYPQQLGSARLKFIKDTKFEITELVEKGKDDDFIFAPCIESPNYMALLKKLDIDLDFFRAMTVEARSKQ
jgi:hypothetical protein